MILLRRGRQTPSVITALDVDISLDLGPAERRGRDCLAPWRPPIEVFETKRALVVRAEIGGLSEADLRVVVDGEQLVIRGERGIARAEDHRLYHESRVRYGPFEASIRLPFPVDVTTAGADYTDGFLTVNLPRLAATRVTAREAGGTGSSRPGGQ